MHGNEPSGSDAAMKLLYELAARTDCANLRRLDRLVTVLVPLQNPDGRANGQRVNAYGFDLNRDWFAATQPETAGKLALLRRLPPILYVDAHEEPGIGGFFFPPNADPIHHEISGQALGAIDGVFGPALQRAFDARGLAYTNYATFDLFFMGYGDTVPTTAFGAAGMTFEKGAQAPFAERMAQHFVAQDTALSTAARQKDRLLTAWAAQWRQARSEGRRGELEPNVVVQPGNRVRFPVPGKRIYAYALAAGENAADAGRLVDRLRSVGVEVSALARARRIERFHAYGEEGSRAVTLPAGTYWISMAQAQKHWVEAMLGEDAYVPFPYFYDVSAWSNPLLMGLHGGAVEAPADPGHLRAVEPRRARHRARSPGGGVRVLHRLDGGARARRRPPAARDPGEPRAGAARAGGAPASRRGGGGSRKRRPRRPAQRRPRPRHTGRRAGRRPGRPGPALAAPRRPLRRPGLRGGPDPGGRQRGMGALRPRAPARPAGRRRDGLRPRGGVRSRRTRSSSSPTAPWAGRAPGPT